MILVKRTTDADKFTIGHEEQHPIRISIREVNQIQDVRISEEHAAQLLRGLRGLPVRS